eukprot:scaffold137622_cov18-Tisochrysis_lutea.AAC.1
MGLDEMRLIVNHFPADEEGTEQASPAATATMALSLQDLAWGAQGWGSQGAQHVSRMERQEEQKP